METEIRDKECEFVRKAWKNFYTHKYKNLWLNRFRLEGMTPQQELFIKNRYWNGEKLGCFKAVKLNESFLGGLPPDAQKTLTTGNATAGFAPVAIVNYSQYDAPTTCNLINERGSPYIPQGLKVIGKDVVVLRGLADEYPFSSLVKRLIEAIVNEEMKMRKNGKLSVGGAGLEVGADCPTRAEELAKKMMSDEAVCAFNGSETAQIHPFNGGQLYQVDKIRTEKEAREAELKCLLGLDSVATEKKERLITSEADSKKTECALSKDVFMNPLRKWFAEIKEVLGYEFTLVDPYEEKDDGSPEGEEGEDDDEDTDAE